MPRRPARARRSSPPARRVEGATAEDASEVTPADAAATAAAFDPPLAGAFFALEESLGSFRVRTFSPVVIASVVGAVGARAVFGTHPAFPIPREHAIPLAVFGGMARWALLLLAVGKVLATSLTLQGGGSAWLFTPSLFVGTPTIGILLAFETTDEHAIMLPLVIAVVITHLVARDDLYSGCPRWRGEPLEHGADRDVLAGHRVADALDAEPVAGAVGVRGEGSLPIGDAATGRLAGVVSRNAILDLYERAVATGEHASTPTH